ncbi:MAG: Hsp70 family protein [Nostoc sp. SerVER01]|nr:Hsp70 family protein [Nostoc sp. SerVER01]
MAKVIGIDLGTTMSVMAYVDEMGRPVIIPNAEGQNITPSVVMIRDAERVIGRRAKNAAVAFPKRVAQFVKREMIRPDWVFKDESGKPHRPEELSALILKKLKQDAEKHLKEEVKKVVITVPAYFGDFERQRTKQAGEIAGFEVLDIINEPTAAAIAYGIRQAQKDMTILVYDLGGGTFDVTVMKVSAGTGELRVLASNGNKFMGGADFDQAICSFFAKQFQAEHHVEPLVNLQTYQDFRDRAEAAKTDLSADVEAYVNLTAEGKVMNIELTRAQVEKLIKPYIDQTQSLTEDVLADASLDWGQVDKVLLVGGSTRIPLVQKMVKELTGKEPEMSFNPDEVVAMGAAIYAAGLGGEVVRDERGNAIAAIKVHNVTAHSLGIIAKDNTATDKNFKLIQRNTEIPATGEDIFTTIEDNQMVLKIQIVQGEYDNPDLCTKVGDAGFLRGIPPKPKGEPQIKVWLSYDASGIIHLRARELETGIELNTKIENKALLSGAEAKKAAQAVAALKIT